MRRKPRTRTKEERHRSSQGTRPRPHLHVKTRLRPDQVVQAPTRSKGAHRPELQKIGTWSTPHHRQAGLRKEPGLTARNRQRVPRHPETTSFSNYSGPTARKLKNQKRAPTHSPAWWTGHTIQMSRGDARRVVLLRTKEAHTQASFTQTGLETSPRSNPAARTNTRRKKTTIPLRGTHLLLLLPWN